MHYGLLSDAVSVVCLDIRSARSNATTVISCSPIIIECQRNEMHRLSPPITCYSNKTGELTSSSISSSLSRRLSLMGLLFSLCCFRAAWLLRGAAVEVEGLDDADRRTFDSWLGEGTETGCEGV